MRINLLGSGVAGRSLPVTAQRRVNLYVERIQDGDKGSAVAYGLPGHKWHYRHGTEPLVLLRYDQYRGKAYFVDFDGAPHLWEYEVSTTPEGPATDIGAVGSSGEVNASFGWCSVTNELVVCATNEGRISAGQLYSSVDGAAVAEVGPDGALPGCVTYGNSRFICDDQNTPGRIYWSDLQDGTSWPDLNWLVIDDVGNIVRLLWWKDTLVVFGDAGIAFFSSSADANQPYQRIIGVKCQAGLNQKYSLAVVGENVVFIARTENGARKVVRLNGYDIQPLGEHDISYSLDRNLSDLYKDFVNYSGSFGYMGHDFYWIQTALSEETFVLDLSSGVWSEIVGCLPCSTIEGKAESRFNDNALCSLSDGNIVELRDDYYTYRSGDTDADITYTLVLPHIHDAANNNRMVMHRFRLDRASTGPDPTLSLSRDGGVNYGAALDGAALGNGLEWRRLGAARDFVLKLDATGDTGPVAWIGAFAEIEVSR